MTVTEQIKIKLAEKNVKLNGALFLDFNDTDTKVTVYDMNYTTFAKRKIGHYLVPFKNLILV